jgi:7-carboxy-7-deazaguanine synthase
VLRVSEVYASVQGEGPRVGETTVFVRFGGCNLRCPGWPCDTQHAIDPSFRNEWERIMPGNLYIRIKQVAELAGAKLITFTGGEPFLQPKDDLSWLIEHLSRDGYRIEAFSNGTLLYPSWAIDHVRFIMDWKLPGSGENHMNPARLENVERLARMSGNAVKFVCKDEDDFLCAVSLWSSYLQGREEIDTYYGRVWEGEITNAHLAELVMTNQLPWKMNVQLHNYIWDPQERGR